jgi:hypothetical protein
MSQSGKIAGLSWPLQFSTTGYQHVAVAFRFGFLPLILYQIRGSPSIIDTTFQNPVDYP